tara:strand:- start:2095 stop:2532 length:438 start_codon:yes stop_codon:yes gene_type:complete
MLESKYFEDFELGDEIGPLIVQADDQQVIDFCELWGNTPPNRFTSKEIAEQTGVGEPIVPGIMSMALVAELFNECGGSQHIVDLDVVFRASVPHNAPLHILGTITDTREEEGQYLVECDILMTGPESQRYVIGTALVSLPSNSNS